MSGTTPDDTPDVSKPNVFRPEGEAAVELKVLFDRVQVVKAIMDKAGREWYEANYAFWNRASELKVVPKWNKDVWQAKEDEKGLYFVLQESLQTMLGRFQEMKKGAVQVQHYEFASECRNLERLLKQALDWQEHHFAVHAEEARLLETTRARATVEQLQAQVDDLRRRFDPTYDMEDHPDAHQQ